MLRDGSMVLENVVYLQMSRMYQVAGHCFLVSGERLCSVLESMSGFEPFAVDCGDALFTFADGADVPDMTDKLYDFSYEDITGIFGRTERGHLLILKPQNEEYLALWNTKGKNEVHISGNLSINLLHFALWIGVGLMLAPCKTVAVHSSCIVYNGQAVLFLGESGTGKSTHTRLWQENIEGAFLLNDDSPFVRVEDGKVWAYGSPWSGKTPCYRQERYELKACVRLSQAPSNHITKLPVLQAYAAIHPSCPPMFAYDSDLYDHISSIIDIMLSSLPLYHLACLPDREATDLAFRTIFQCNKN